MCSLSFFCAGGFGICKKILGMWLMLACVSAMLAEPVITEFAASNKSILPDEDGDFSDWIEVYNPDTVAVNLDGWYLTDDAGKKTKWQFPAVTLPAGGYLVVFASSKDRKDPTQPLHTNFSLGADGEYLGLIKPDGVTATTEFAPEYPPQSNDLSYGVTQPEDLSEAPQFGYFATPTPGARNGDARSLALLETVAFSQPPGLFRDTLALELSGSATGQHIRYVIAPPSAGGADVPEPTADSPQYTGPIALTSSVIVRAAVFVGDDTHHGATATAHYLRLAATGDERLDTFSSQLPLLVVDNHGYGPMVKDGIDHPAWIYGFAGADGQDSSLLTESAFALPAAISIRGQSSSFFPKKSLKLKFKNTAGGKQTVAPFGLPAFDKWQLVGSWFYDRAFIRNACIYSLSNRLGRWAPRTRFVEVFLNTGADGLDAADYAGIYTLTDKIEINSKRVAIAKLSASDAAEPEVTGGYILKFDKPDPGDYAWQTDHGFTLILDTPDADDATEAQRSYIQGYVQAFENALFTDRDSGWATHTHLDYIDRGAWVDFHILNVLAKNADGFTFSTYLTKDRGGKLSAGPVWDFDRSMGSNDERTTAWDEWRNTGGGDGWNSGWWGLLAHDPDFMQAWIDRWQSLRTDQFSNVSLSALVDDLGAQIGSDAAGRDGSRYPDDVSSFPDGYFGEIAHVKDWLLQRARWIDQQFLTAPQVVLSDDRVTFTPAAGAQLAYTLDGTDPRLDGGQLSSSAVVTSTPITVASTATLFARSYRADFAQFPATPWSRSVGLADATTIDAPEIKPIGDATVAAGHGVSFSAGNTPGAIQWQISTDNGATWNDLADDNIYVGTSAPVLSIVGVSPALDGAQYRYVVSYGGGTFLSNAATLAVASTFFPYPTGIIADPTGNLFVSDAKAGTVQKIDTSGHVSLLAGKSDTAGLTDGAGTAARFNQPRGLALLADGSLLLADAANATLRHITLDGTVTTLAGQPDIRGNVDGPGTTATFSLPTDVAVDTNGAIFVTDALNNTLRRIATDGDVTTLAGTAELSGTKDAIGEKARFNHPTALAIDHLGNVFVSDATNNTVRRITPTGDVATLAGLPGVSGFDDGTGSGALFNHPGGLAIDDTGTLFVADTGNSTVRKITPDGTVTTLAGAPGIAGAENGVGSGALFNRPQDLTLSANGDLYVADTGNALIRKITPAGAVSTLLLAPAAPDQSEVDPGSGSGSNDSGSDHSNSGGNAGAEPPPDSSHSGGGAPGIGFLLGLAVLLAARGIRRKHPGTAA